MSRSLNELVGTAIEKSCPDCGGSLIIRQNSESLDYFLGCLRYPRCLHTEQIPEEYLMREAGQASFFD